MKKKWKKCILIITCLFVIIGIILFTCQKQKEAEARNKKQLEKDYFYQNSAFFASDTDTKKYASYSTINLNVLQVYINYYHEATGKDITLSDIEEFLKDQYKKNGKPKTYKDDEGMIYDYVKYYNNNYTDFTSYLSKLEAILVEYVIENPECPYRTTRDLSLDSINELSKKYQNGEYQLILD